MKEISVELIKYDIDFTKRAKDIKRNVWFSFPNDLLLHPDFDDINGEELKWFVWCVSICSKVNNSKIRLNLEHACRKINVKEKDFHSMCEKLKEKQILIDATARRPPDDRQTTATLQTDITKQTDSKLFDFLKVYEIYPKKEGKSKGLIFLAKDIKNEADYQLLIKSVTNYKSKISSERTEMQYVKLFSTWANEWRDWIDFNTTKVTIGASKQKEETFTHIDNFEYNDEARLKAISDAKQNNILKNTIEKIKEIPKK